MKKAFYWLTLRVHKELGKWFSKGIAVAIVTTTRCNLTCNYCPMFIHGEVKKYNDCTFDEWKEYLGKFPYWISQIYISGGEPSLYKDIVPLVNWLIERGHHVIIYSNLWKPENFLGIKPHWRLLFIPTLHPQDNVKRFTKALEILKDFQVFPQSTYLNKFKARKLLSVDYFLKEQMGFQLAPDTPRTNKLFTGCADVYKRD